MTADQPGLRWRPLFTRLLSEVDARTNTDWQAPTTAVDPMIYCDPHRYALERQRLFRRLPVCLGHADQIAEPGSVLALDLCGLPILLARHQDGSLRVLLNVCRHRGVRLVADDGVVCRKAGLTCPYHAWSYRLDGALAGVPRREAFLNLDREKLGLRQLPSIVRHGLVWTLLDTNTAPDDLNIPAYLGDIDSDLEAIGMGHHRFFRQHMSRRKTNWKLIIEAFLELYHVKRLHAGTIGSFFHDAASVSDCVGLHQRLLVARDRTTEIRDLPPEAWHPQVHGTLVHFVFPNSIIIYHPDYISHIGLFPSAPNETLFVHSMLTPHIPVNAAEEAHWARSFELIDEAVFNSEDLFICEQIQKGLESGANDRFVLGCLEQNISRFHTSLETALHGSSKMATFESK